MSRIVEVTAPTIEPVTLAEVKEYLRISDDALDSVQSIAPASHATGAATGTGIDIAGYSAVVTLDAGVCGSGGTVNAKIQESDNGSDYEDVSGGSFDEVSEANDNANYEVVYTGSKRYIRAVATIAGASCIFGMAVVKKGATAVEDIFLTNLIKAGREFVEATQRRALMTQTWKLLLDEWPGGNTLEVPLPPLQSITSIKYKDHTGNESTFSDSYYIVDTERQPGRIVLAYNQSWPSTTALYPSNPIYIEYVCGYGTSPSAVPERTRLGLKMLIAHFYENREAVTFANIKPFELPLGVRALLYSKKIWRF